MMKIKMYADIYEGMRPDFLSANAQIIMELSKGHKRISFIVDVPDHLFTGEIEEKVKASKVTMMGTG